MVGGVALLGMLDKCESLGIVEVQDATFAFTVNDLLVLHDVQGLVAVSQRRKPCEDWKVWRNTDVFDDDYLQRLGKGTPCLNT